MSAGVPNVKECLALPYVQMVGRACVKRKGYSFGNDNDFGVVFVDRPNVVKIRTVTGALIGEEVFDSVEELMKEWDVD